MLVDGVLLTLGWDHRRDRSVVPMLAANHVGVPLPLEFRARGSVEYLGRQWCAVPDVEQQGMALDPST